MIASYSSVPVVPSLQGGQVFIKVFVPTAIICLIVYAGLEAYLDYEKGKGEKDEL
jgi:hypothetical protein